MRLFGPAARGFLVSMMLAASASAQTPSAPPQGPPSPPQMPEAFNTARAAAQAAVASPDRRPTSELIYTPITPCRAFNTAAVIPANTTKGFQVTGAASLAFQGGPAAGCGIPASASAVAISLTTVGATSAGFLTAFANDQPRPGVYSHFTNPNQPATSGAVVKLSASGGLSVYAQRPTKVVGDVTGYYAPPIAGMIASDGSVYSGTGRILSASIIATGVVRVTVDRDVTYCTPTATSYSGVGVYAST